MDQREYTYHQVIKDQPEPGPTLAYISNNAAFNSSFVTAAQQAAT